jgi:hypothetical protein
MSEEKKADILEKWPEPFLPNDETLKAAVSDEPFIEASFELIKETAIIAVRVSSIVFPQPLSRNNAILFALMLKSAKLLSANLELAIKFGEERQMALIRELFECLTVLDYLLADQDGSRFEAYVTYSLATDKAALETYISNAKKRGEQLPIESDMEVSIRKTAEFAGISSIDGLPGKKHAGWPNIEAMLGEHAGYAYPAYRGGSSVIHTGWADLLRNYLTPVEGGFELLFEQRGPGPEPMYASALYVSTVMDNFLRRIDEQAWTILQEKITNLQDRIMRVGEDHSAFRNRQRGHS